MTLRRFARSAPKAGRSVEENEDAVAVDPLAGRYAVADGVSTSARPELWSDLLVQEFVHSRVDPDAPEVLRHLAGRWKELSGAADLPWYAQEKLAQGSAATFVGLQINHRTGVFQARAVGDACMFHVRGNRLLRSFPLTSSAQFGDRPPQLTTSGGPGAQTVQGQAERWDQMFLATDAMAKFLLLVHERRGSFPPIADLVRGDHFQEYVDWHRQLGRLDNDDTTLCAVTV